MLQLKSLVERSAKSFVRYDMVVYAMVLAYRELFALLPFAVFLVAVLRLLYLYILAQAVLLEVEVDAAMRREPLKRVRPTSSTQTSSPPRTVRREEPSGRRRATGLGAP